MTVVKSFDNLISFLLLRNDSDFEWYYKDDFWDPEFDNNKMVGFISEFYSRVTKISKDHSQSSIYHALNYTVNTTCGHLGYLISNEAIEAERRVELVDSMFILFRDYFNSECANTSIRNKVGFNQTINMVCYMWWELVSWQGIPYRHDMKSIDESILKCLENILRLDNEACKESAIHGLGHWYDSYPERVESIIAGNRDAIPIELKDYATQAVTGRVL